MEESSLFQRHLMIACLRQHLSDTIVGVFTVMVMTVGKATNQCVSIEPSKSQEHIVTYVTFAPVSFMTLKRVAPINALAKGILSQDSKRISLTYNPHNIHTRTYPTH